MTATGTLNWRPELLVPDPTVWLPIASERPLGELAKESAATLLGPGATRKQLQALAQTVEDGTIIARRRHAMMAGLMFYPDLTRTPAIAEIDVHGFFPADPGEPLRLERYRRLYGTPDKQTIGPVEVSEIDLPAGPALRFHRHRIPKPDWQGVSIEREDVIYAVRPPQIDDAVVIFVSWVEKRFSQALITSTDEIARTLKITLTGDS